MKQLIVSLYKELGYSHAAAKYRTHVELGEYSDTAEPILEMLEEKRATKGISSKRHKKAKKNSSKH